MHPLDANPASAAGVFYYIPGDLDEREYFPIWRSILIQVGLFGFKPIQTDNQLLSTTTPNTPPEVTSKDSLGELTFQSTAFVMPFLEIILDFKSAKMLLFRQVFYA